MIGIYIWLGVLTIAVISAVVTINKMDKSEVLDLKDGEHLPVIKKDESNVSVKRVGDQVVLVDEEGKHLRETKLLK